MMMINFCSQATLSLLLDHLSLVASFSSFNRMTHQNLAVCFGPVLLTPTQEIWRARERAEKTSRGVGKFFSPGEEMLNAVNFKWHIEALHYLLQLWPGETRKSLSIVTLYCCNRKKIVFDIPPVLLSADSSSSIR